MRKLGPTFTEFWTNMHRWQFRGWWQQQRPYQLKNKKLSYRQGTVRCIVSVEICQMPPNSAETTCTTSPEQIEVMKLNCFSKAMCNKHVHSTMTRSSRFHCPVGVISKPTTVELWYHLYTDDLLWQNFLSPQCRNCSRDPDHAHLGNTHSSQD